MDLFVYEILIIILIIWFFLYPILYFIPWYQWYRIHDPGNNYSCFSIASIAYYEYNNIAYRLLNLLTPPTFQFKYDWWVLFISGIMAGEAVDIVANGICTPQTLCDSLIPYEYPLTVLPGTGRRWPITVPEWQNLILNWTGMSQVPSDPSGWQPNVDTWQSAPDNFLNAWGIPPNSPAVIGFVTNWSSFNGDVIFPNVLNPLLGIKQGPVALGGWFGFLQQGDNFGTYGLDEANRVVWSTEIPVNIANSQSSTTGCSTAGIVSGAFSGGLGGGFAGAPIAGALAGAAAGSTVPVVGTIIGAVLGIAIGGILAAWSGGCFASKSSSSSSNNFVPQTNNIQRTAIVRYLKKS